jgi:sporulation protein YlmC with PRC-barrel domain
MSLTVLLMLDAKTLLKLPVWTKSNIRLGRVVGFDFDEESQMVVRWRVRPVGVASRLVGGELLVGREQVIAITADRMIVDDLLARELELSKAKALSLLADAA